MNTNDSSIDEDEIDIKEIFRTVFRYKYMIISLVILFTLGSAFFAYFKTNVYKTTSTVEVRIDKMRGAQQDVLAMAMDGGSMVNPDTEMEIIRSVSLTEKALKHVDMTHHYYTTRRYKKVELYKNSPFEVGMLRGYGILFDLIPVDEKMYRLLVKDATDENRSKWSYAQEHAYGQEVVNDHFHLNVLKNKEMKEAVYHFSVTDPKVVPYIVQAGVSVAQTSKYSTVLAISYTDNVPLRTQEFTNALTKAYVDRSIDEKNREAELKLKFIDKQLNRINDTLTGSAIKLEEFKRKSNTVDLSAKATKIISLMSAFETELNAIEIRQKMLNKLYKEMKSGENIESISLGGMMADPSLALTVKELQNAIIKRKSMLQTYTNVYPAVRQLNGTIAKQKNIIVSTMKNLSENITEKQALLRESIKEQQKLLNTLPADERVYGELQRQFAVNEKIYSYLLEKQSETAIIKASTVSKNIILDKAPLPVFPIEPKRKLIVMIGLILGLILGIALAFLRSFLDDRIRSEEDVTHATNVPMIGMIPHMKAESGLLKVLETPKSAVAEAFRNLRTNLQFMVHGEKSHVVAVTSTIGGEGKTLICSNLSAIMSIADKKTIVINLDMRKPTLHARFSVPNKQGMSTLLSGSSNLESVIQKTDYPNLHVITSGPVPPNPSELIQSPLMEKVIGKLREHYDVIILDTPPIGLVTDARTLMNLADTSIYVLRAGYSKKSFINSIKALSNLHEVHGLTILLNDMKMDKSGYGYGYGYGYYEDEK